MYFFISIYMNMYKYKCMNINVCYLQREDVFVSTGQNRELNQEIK